ncbi:hypothetical protein WCD74_01375 [Actinomycetospora sp. OC33-EN08]|uniref:O-antigen ligase domain-containing protein n=1 Tax=Actinomycetospora aurantiaca TaxID=3129233 RepID=A0ABU8MGD4_9PSEU
MNRVAAVVLGAIGVLAAGAVLVATLTSVPPWAVVAAVGGLTAVGVLWWLRGPDDVGIALLVLAVFSSPWNAVGVGSLKPGPVLLAASLLVLGVQAVRLRRPISISAWLWPLAVAVLVVAVITMFVPPSPSYMAGRFYADETFFDLWELQHVAWGSALDAAQWLVAILGLVFAATLAVRLRPALPPVLADAWVAGAGVSALVALTDQFEFTAVSAKLLPFVDVGGRQAGLTVQPNHLAMGALLVLPLAVWRAVSARGRASRLVATAVVLLLLGGIVVAQSRGALAVSLLVLVVALVLHRRGRLALAPLAVLVVVAISTVLLAVPGAARKVGEALRLTGQDSAVASNLLRDMLTEQTLRDIGSSPWHGIGFQVAVAGHNIWLQLLACGGVIVFLGFLVTLVGFVAEAWGIRDRYDGLPLLLMISVGAWLVAGIVENNLTDLFLYVPFAIVAAVKAADMHRTAVGAAVLVPGGARS